MRLFRHYDNLPPDARSGAVAIGNFDGVHLGHQAVIGEAGRIARSTGVPWSVLTLEPHPRSVFHPDAPPFRLTTFHAKARLIEAMGVDVMVVVPFNAEFATLAAVRFVEEILVHGLAARAVISGHDFHFGRGREGHPDLLLELGKTFDFDYTCVHEVKSPDGEPYSSTRIRDALRQGDLDRANRLLGRPFEIEGRIVQGERRGRTIGYPTANIALGDYIRPAFGVYAVGVAIEDGPWRNGIANIGVRPSFGGTEPLLEAHLFDTDDDLYGRHARVRLCHYLRAEKRFDGLDGLKAQIAVDSARARLLLADLTDAPRDSSQVSGT
ncbi:MAG: bifunctional riboflavin kinase/FAD synthetase [Rhodospirillales bacterium]|nr:MAG: bifunctional riboflavin kinase/FAD synthetase [Rhodospirillales bacterium]